MANTLSSQDRDLLIAIAKLFIDTPYQFWGNGSLPWEGLDCSRFTQLIYSCVWIEIERSSAQQGEQFKETWAFFEDLWKAEVWDLIFFKKTYSSENEITHVVIAVWKNKMIHAGSPKVAISTIDSYWKSHFKAVWKLSVFASSYDKQIAAENYERLNGNWEENSSAQGVQPDTLKAVNAVIAVLTSTWADLPEHFQELSASYAKELRETYPDARKLEKEQAKKVYQSMVDFLSYAYKYAWDEEKDKYSELAWYLRNKFKLL